MCGAQRGGAMGVGRWARVRARRNVVCGEIGRPIGRGDPGRWVSDVQGSNNFESCQQKAAACITYVLTHVLNC